MDKPFGTTAIDVAHLLMKWWEEKVQRNFDISGPPLIRDTFFDEEGIYLNRPLEFLEGVGGALEIQINGRVFSWTGEKFQPANQVIEVLDIVIIPLREGNCRLEFYYHFALGSFGEWVQQELSRYLNQKIEMYPVAITPVLGTGSPRTPSEPGPDATRDDWHRYRYECEKLGIRVPHSRFAERFHVTEGTARNYYSNWKAENVPDYEK